VGRGGSGEVPLPYICQPWVIQTALLVPPVIDANVPKDIHMSIKVDLQFLLLSVQQVFTDVIGDDH